MKMKIVPAAALALVLTTSSHAALAVPIDYIFNGVGTGTLDGASFSGDFNVTYLGGTLTVQNPSSNFFTNDAVGTFFTAGPLSAAFNTGTYVVLNTTPSIVNIGFAQNQPAPVFSVNEALVNNAFAGYDLASPFPLTGGNVSFSDQTYLTDRGNLDFTSISSLTFEAVEPGLSPIPLPSTLPMLGAGILSLLAYAWGQKRRV